MPNLTLNLKEITTPMFRDEWEHPFKKNDERRGDGRRQYRH